MLARRLRRRPNIDPTLIQCLVLAGLLGPIHMIQDSPSYINTLCINWTILVMIVDNVQCR